MEILYRVWDDLHNKVIQGFKIISDEKGTTLDVSGCEIYGDVYPDRFIIEPYTNRKDHKNIYIFEGDVILPIYDPENPGDFILLESEVKYYDGCWILEEMESGKFKPMYELDQKDFKIKQHVNYGNYVQYIKNDVLNKYFEICNKPVTNVSDLNLKAKLKSKLENPNGYGNLSYKFKGGAALSWYTGIYKEEQQAYNFDFGLLRKQKPDIHEIMAMYKMYIVDGIEAKTFSPDNKK